MGKMAAIRQHVQRARQAGPSGDMFRMASRTVFIAVAMQGQQRTAALRQCLVEPPCGKPVRQPGVDPGPQHLSGLVAVILVQALPRAGSGKLLFRSPDAGPDILVHESLCRFGDDACAGVRPGGRAIDCHAASDAVAQHHEPVEPKLPVQAGKSLICFSLDEIR